MKFRQLIEYTMRNIFLEKSYAKCGETSPRHFPEKSKLSISLAQQSKVLLQFVFNECYVKRYRNILKLSCRSPAFILH